MNKRKTLAHKTGITGAVALVIFLVFVGVWYFTDSYATGQATKKTDADNALNRDKAQIASFRNQLEKSGEAEKRFVDIQLGRSNIDFTANTNVLRKWLADAKTAYRFANSFKLSIAPEKKTDKADLSGLDYDVTTRGDMKLEIDAISDLHVFSFLDAMAKQSPGFIRINEIVMKRKGDMDAGTYAQMVTGAAPTLISATINFNWIGIEAKATKAETPQ